MSEELPQLIKCGDHGKAPWCIMCIHLMDGTASKAIAIDNLHIKEVDYDWACPECYELVGEVEEDENKITENFRCVCMNCANEVVENYEKEFPEDD
jgi:hypothetical protein